MLVRSYTTIPALFLEAPRSTRCQIRAIDAVVGEIYQTAAAGWLDQGALPRPASTAGHGNYRLGGDCMGGKSRGARPNP